jgi:hypothetical protein
MSHVNWLFLQWMSPFKGNVQMTSVVTQTRGHHSMSYRLTIILKMVGLLETWPNVEVRSVVRNFACAV